MGVRVVEVPGARIIVDVLRSDDASVVKLVTPGAADVPLLPDDARRLAVALIEAAARAEAPEPAPWP